MTFVKAHRASSPDDHETWAASDVAPTLNTGENKTSTRATILARTDDTSGTVTANWYKGVGNTQVEMGIAQPIGDGVRRLTPRECERLMGWPDDHTRWGDDGTEIADSHRYRMCGNGVVAPVAAWIGERLPS